jgi:hypothetical protein
MEKEKASSQTSPTAKKVYRSPELVEYGHVRKITRGQTGSSPDGGSGMAMN